MWMIGIGLGAAALLADRLTKKRRLRRPLRLLGAALLAGWGSGMIARGEVPTPREAAAYAPTPALAARAEAAYRRYRRLYAALKPLFSDE